MKSVVLLLGVASLLSSAGSAASGPSAMGSPQQLDWLSRQIGVMITYNMQTYNKAMTTGHVVPASDFAPDNVSIAGEWLDTAAAFGAKYAVLTTDHFSGFNLWPSQAWGDRGLSPYTVVSFAAVAAGVLGAFGAISFRSLLHSWLDWSSFRCIVRLWCRLGHRGTLGPSMML
jgi:hypothetical protein